MISSCLTLHLYSEDQTVSLLTPELNPSAQSCLPRFFTGYLIFKGLTARRLYESFGFKELMLRREIIHFIVGVMGKTLIHCVENMCQCARCVELEAYFGSVLVTRSHQQHPENGDAVSP
jgi:hypothetical protein